MTRMEARGDGEANVKAECGGRDEMEGRRRTVFSKVQPVQHAIG